MNEVLEKILTDKSARSDEKTQTLVVVEDAFETWE